ncbi:hypothetical protein DYB32_005103 [Aphanomyces invadans]|uniref:CAMK/CAMK1 protein kinase n=1 Tax=Aphanomyces invadans TaxID=157072 RepID=A0A418AVF6_9STRA|nr:hypothetical protein DYB32_005103 [Aphanomyces invadans]
MEDRPSLAVAMAVATPGKSKEDVLHSGILLKRGHLRKNWLTRFFVLTSGALRYFRKPPGGGAKCTTWSVDPRYLRGELPLADIIHVECDDSTPQPAYHPRTYRFTITVLRHRILFLVRRPVRFHLQATTEDERERWVRVLREPRKQLSKVTLPRHTSALDLYMHFATAAHEEPPVPSNVDKGTAKMLSQDFPLFLALLRDMHVVESAQDLVRILDQVQGEVDDGRYNDMLKRMLAVAAELKLEMRPSLWTKDVQVAYSSVMKSMYRSQPNSSNSRLLHPLPSSVKQQQASTTMMSSSKYTLGRILGSGAHSIVRVGYTASHTQVAVKCIAKSHVQLTPALLQEVELLKSLSHPNLVTCLDFYEAPGFYGVVTPLCTGGMLLTDLMTRPRYTEADARRVIAQLASAIAYLHINNVIHRDIKPENILLYTSSANSPILLADFGFAKRLVGGVATRGTSCGTPGYMAPEVLLGHDYGTPVDCWSLGVILFILLCGKPPFPGANPADICNRVVQAKVVLDHPNWANVSEAGKQLTLKLLVANPSKRLTAAEVLEDPWMTQTTASDKALELSGVLDTLRSITGVVSDRELSLTAMELDEVDDALLEMELCAPLDGD